MSLLKKEVQDFIIVSKYLNFSKASDYLGVKQSGLSKSIAKIEKELGHKLFIRKARGLDLTPVGKIYFDKVILTQNVWEELQQAISSIHNELNGEFKIGFHPILAKFILPKLINSLKDLPGIKLKYDFSSSRNCNEMVINNELDLSIVASPIEYPDLIIKKLWKEHIGLYSIDRKMKKKILYNSNMLNSYKILSQFSDYEQQSIDDYEILYSLIKRTNSMGLLPHPLAMREKRLKEIKRFSPGIDICLVYRSDRFKSNAFVELAKRIKHLELHKEFS